ncbi:AfsR/SARP family transcriptional regulator [Nonomuraea soli]|uniref:DNA-binding SARP family transcriptional activator n=1 Tax=Nonomuraea soli TaxID=1032476 RepID=A0A7W0CSP6_9ACTN|nr:BTAD domain-containing putative transcriptional regulator [Nonomuraea soli]MBA2896611.1 DNA-binding SARP family transcriptional activator [Nonomuraea soli]
MRFGVLGPVSAHMGEEAVPLGPPKRRLLLAVLLCSPGRAVDVDRLVEALWTDAAPASAVENVYQHVSQLRRVLGSETITGRGRPGYVLAVDAPAVDAHRFAEQAQAGAQALAAGDAPTASRILREALALWRGPAFGDLAGELCLREEAVRLEELRLAALEDRVEADLALGLHDDVIGELTALTQAHPYRERYTGQLMLALYRAQRQSEALEAYTRARRRLTKELGLEPGTGLSELHGRILARDPALEPDQGPSRRRPAQLPRSVPDFTGRQAEITQILARLDEERTADGVVIITAIDGMAGVGKTALAVRVAHRLTEWYPDGQLFVDLHAHTAGYQETCPAEALAVLLRAIGVGDDRIPAGLDARSALWRSELAGRRMLIVLDNAVSAEQVRPLLPGSSGCLVLVTSRRRLADLDGIRPMVLDVLPPAEAASLFATIVGERARAEPEAVAEAVELCGRLPLAIRLAAARLGNRPQWTVHSLVGRLRDERRRLAELSSHDRSVEAAFTLSYQQLDTDQQRLFRLLGLTPGVETDAYAVAALADVPLEKADLLLEALLDAQMLQQPALGRYTFHDLIRQFAAERAQLEEPGPERLVAVNRVLDYFSHTARVGADLLQPGRMPLDLGLRRTPGEAPALKSAEEATAWFAEEKATLVAAVHRAGTLGLELPAWHLTRDLGVYVMKTAHPADVLELEEAAVSLARRLPDRRLLALSLLNLSSSLSHSGDLPRAVELTEQAGVVAEELGDERLTWSSRRFLASLHQRVGRFPEAEAGFARAVEWARGAGERYTEAVVMAFHGDVLTLLGREREALRVLEGALELATELDHTDAVIQAATSAARAAIALGELSRAGACVELAVEGARVAGMRAREVTALQARAELLRVSGRQEEALACVRHAYDMAVELEYDKLECEVRVEYGDLLRHGGHLWEARAHYEAALALAEPRGDRYEQTRALDGLARIHHALGEHEQADRHWARALPMAEDMGLPLAVHIRSYRSV